MLKRIALTNFRGFRELSIPEDLSPVTVLLGPNSSGKTTMLHAIRLACQAVHLALSGDSVPRIANKKIEVAKDVLIDSHSQLLPLADWQALFVDQQVGQGSSFSIQLWFEPDDQVQELALSVSYARNQKLKFSLTVDASNAVSQAAGLPRGASRADMLRQWLTDNAPRAVFIPPFYGVVKDEEYRPRVVVDRLVGSGDQSHVVRNLITGMESYQLTQLNAFLSDLTGASIDYRTSGDAVETESPLRATFRDTNGPIEISAAGAGFINLVALYASLARWQASAKSGLVIFLLDEPEAHLHPRLQGETARRMASLVVEEFGAQLFMATHSVEIINRLGEHPDAKLLRTDRSATPSVTVLGGQQEILGDMANWADLTPFTSINFMASRRVLFHEGPSDAPVLRCCAKLRFRQQAVKRRQFERWALVQLNGSGNEKTVDLLKRLLGSGVWRENAEASTFRLAMILDRDHCRTPGFNLQNEDNQPSSATLVWSRHSIESLFISAQVLPYWVRAFAGDCAPENLDDLVAAAIAQANQDDTLRNETVDQLTLNLQKQKLEDAKGKELAVNTDPHRLRAMELARERYANQPDVYQRGKNRAAFILGKIRPHIALPKQNRFPTDVTKLIQHVDLNQISDPVAAVPAEMATLLDWMVETD